MGNVSSKPSVGNVKSSDGTPGRILVSRVYKSACVMVFSSHVYEWPAKLENQRTADAKQSLWAQQFSDVFGEGNKNSELYFTPFFIWWSEDKESILGRTVWKTFWKRRLTNATLYTVLASGECLQLMNWHSWLQRNYFGIHPLELQRKGWAS